MTEKPVVVFHGLQRDLVIADDRLREVIMIDLEVIHNGDCPICGDECIEEDEQGRQICQICQIDWNEKDRVLLATQVITEMGYLSRLPGGLK